MAKTYRLPGAITLFSGINIPKTFAFPNTRQINISHNPMTEVSHLINVPSARASWFLTSGVLCWSSRGVMSGCLYSYAICAPLRKFDYASCALNALHGRQKKTSMEMRDR